MNNTKKIVTNGFIFIILFVLTYSIIFKDKNITNLLYNLRSIKYSYVILCIFMAFMYFYIEAYNNKKILESFNHHISMLKSLKFTLIGFFFSSITPASTGGQPMQIYYMSKEKINISHAAMTLLINLCGYLISTIFLGIFCAITYPAIVNKVLVLFIIGTLFNSISLTFTLIAIFNNKLAKRIISFFMKILVFFKYKKIDGLKMKLSKELEIYQESADYIKNNKEMFLKAVLRAFLQLIVYHSLPYFTYLSLGLNSTSIFEFIILQSILHCTVSSIPLPGTVGINESVFLAIYGGIFGELLLTEALVVHRFFSFYLFVFISFIVLICNVIYLSKKQKKS